MKPEPKQSASARNVKKFRESWAELDMPLLSLYVSREHHAFLRAWTNMTVGAELLERLENGDEKATEVMSDKKPKHSITYQKILQLGMEGASESKLIRRDKLLGARLSADEAIEKGRDAMKRGDYEGMAYWYAREYALSIYIRGAYELLSYELDGGQILPKDLAFDTAGEKDAV